MKEREDLMTYEHMQTHITCILLKLSNRIGNNYCTCSEVQFCDEKLKASMATMVCLANAHTGPVVNLASHFKPSSVP